MSNLKIRLSKAEKALKSNNQGINSYEQLREAIIEKGEKVDWQSTPFLRQASARLLKRKAEWEAEEAKKNEQRQ